MADIIANFFTCVFCEILKTLFTIHLIYIFKTLYIIVNFHMDNSPLFHDLVFKHV